MSWQLFSYWSMQLMLIGIIVKLVAVGVLWRTGWARRYKYATVFLVGRALRSAYLLWCGFHWETGYNDAWLDTQSLVNLLWLLVALEAYLAMAKHFPLTEITFVYVAVLASLGWLAARLFRGHTAFPGPVGEALTTTATVLTIAASVVILGGAIYKFFADFRLRRNVVVFVPIVAILILGQLIMAERQRRSGKVRDWEQATLALSTTVAAGVWAWRMRRDGDDFTLPPPDPVKLLKGIYALRRLRQDLRGLRGASGGDAPLSDHF